MAICIESMSTRTVTEFFFRTITEIFPTGTGMIEGKKVIVRVRFGYGLSATQTPNRTEIMKLQNYPFIYITD